jgi:hypothetical protein
MSTTALPATDHSCGRRMLNKVPEVTLAAQFTLRRFGLGTTGTSYLFLGCILALVVFLSVTRRDATKIQRGEALPDAA